MFKWAWLTRLLDDPPTYINHFNWLGPVPSSMNWDYASRSVELHPWCKGFAVICDHCPDCGSPLVQKKYDWWTTDTKGGGQYMVSTNECPRGHGAHLEWA